MSLKGQALRDLVMERLVVAADEIFALFERTIAEYEEEALRSRLQLQEPRVERPAADVQTLLLHSEVGSEHTEEEQALYLKQEEKPPLGFPFTPFSVKTENNVDKSSLLHQEPAEASREDTVGEQCEEEEPGCSLDLPSENEEQTYSCSDTDDSEDWDSPTKTQTKCDGQETNSVHMKDSETGRAAENARLFFTGKKSSSDMSNNTMINLQKHKLIHSGKRRFNCSVFQKHLNMDEKPFKCPVCKKGFNQKCNLKRHMQTHTEEKSFSCPECGLRLKQRHNMLRHISTVHRGEKPHACPFCEKAFAQKSDFIIHMRTHTGEKPFICTVCKKGFSVRGSLNRHIQKTHTVVQNEVKDGVTWREVFQL